MLRCPFGVRFFYLFMFSFTSLVWIFYCFYPLSFSANHSILLWCRSIEVHPTGTVPRSFLGTLASVLTPSKKSCISQFVFPIPHLRIQYFSEIDLFSINMPCFFFFELRKWRKVVDIDNFACLVPLHIPTLYSKPVVFQNFNLPPCAAHRAVFSRYVYIVASTIPAQ